MISGGRCPSVRSTRSNTTTGCWWVWVDLTVAASALAFGSVYPWGYFPLFSIAAAIGVAGLVRGRRVQSDSRGLIIGLVLAVGAGAMQCIPLPTAALQWLTPHAIDLLGQFSLAFAAGRGLHSASIDPSATIVALIALASLGLYLVGLPKLLTANDVRRVPGYVMLFAVPLALWGIVSRERNNGLIYGFWRPIDGGGANAVGPFVNRNHFAGWMLMALCLALGALLGMTERVARARPSPTVRRSSPVAYRIFLAAVSVGVMTLSLVWTMSRSGIASLACALACFALLVVRRRRLGAWGRPVALAMLVVLLGASAGWRGFERLGLWFADTGDLLGRFDAWRDGWRVVREFPLVGTGLNTYPTAMLFYQQHNPALFVAQAHNDYLQLLAEGGLLVTMPALLTMIALALAIRRNLFRARHEGRGYWIRAGAAVGLIAIALQETVEFSLQIPANAFLFCTLAGLALAPVENLADGATLLRDKDVLDVPATRRPARSTLRIARAPNAGSAQSNPVCHEVPGGE